MWVGAFESVGNKYLCLHEIRSNARWRKRVTEFRLAGISRVAVGSCYTTALASIAGERPKPKR